jgi:aryl-alcohol dehydrogenase-like predicted oxidoreductase
MTAMIDGYATAAGTARYAARFGGRLPADHFRRLGRDLVISSLGIGTYLGPDDDATDALYTKAVARALERGINVIDTAVNYRNQRSERAIGVALAQAIGAGVVQRDEVLVATKGGFVAFDGAVPADPARYVAATYVESGIVQASEIVGGQHCMSARYLDDQIDRSRANLGLSTIDLYYVHNPESQLEEIPRESFLRRIRVAFAALEKAAGAGRIRMYGTATWTGYRQPPTAVGALSLPELVDAARDVGGSHHHFRVIQLPYNLAMPEAFVGANQRLDNAMLSPLAAAERLGVYVMASASVHQGGLARNLPPVVAEYLPGLTTDAQRALQFVRSTPGVGTALVGMKSLAHVDENSGVAAVPPVPWEQFQRLFKTA